MICEGNRKLEWRKIDKYSSKYFVSNFGDIYSAKTNKLLKKSDDGYGYDQVNLYYGGKVHPIKVHRLVAEAFVPNPLNKPQVNHKDRNRKNNFFENLEWCTNTENNRNRKDNLLIVYNNKKMTTIEISQKLNIKEGTLRWWIRKFGKEYVEKMLDDMKFDSAYMFLQEFYCSKNLIEVPTRIYEKYKDFCIEINIIPLPRNTFYERLRKCINGGNK